MYYVVTDDQFLGADSVAHRVDQYPLHCAQDSEGDCCTGDITGSSGRQPHTSTPRKATGIETRSAPSHQSTFDVNQLVSVSVTVRPSSTSPSNTAATHDALGCFHSINFPEAETLRLQGNSQLRYGAWTHSVKPQYFCFAIAGEMD